MEFYQSEFSLEVLHQCGAVLHPISAIHINHIAHGADFRAMNVSANHAVRGALAAELDQCLLVVRDVLHRGLRFELNVRGERPIAKSKTSPDAVHPDVHVQDLVVEHGTDAIEQPVEVREAVELMSVQDEITLAVGGDVHRAFDESDRAEAHAEELLEEFVVIAGDEGDFGALAVFPKQLLDEHVVVFRPKPFASQLPAVDEVADDVEVRAFGVAEEGEEFLHLGMSGTQMNIGDPDGAIVHK